MPWHIGSICVGVSHIDRKRFGIFCVQPAELRLKMLAVIETAADCQGNRTRAGLLPHISLNGCRPGAVIVQFDEICRRIRGARGGQE